MDNKELINLFSKLYCYSIPCNNCISIDKDMQGCDMEKCNKAISDIVNCYNRAKINQSLKDCGDD